MNIKDLKNYTVIGGTNTGIPSSAIKPRKSLGQKILNTATDVANFAGGKGLQEKIGADLAYDFVRTDQFSTKAQKQSEITQPSTKQVLGSALQTGANFIPGLGEAGLGAKVLAGAATGLAFDAGSKLQEEKSVGEAFTPGVGTAVGGGLPIVGTAVVRPATRIMKRLITGIGSGLSGVSTDTINKIVNNPKYALESSKRLAISGNNKILEDNARTIVNGYTKIQNEASSAYRHGLDQLSEVDINPNKLKEGFFGALQKNKIGVSEDGVVDFSNAEFLDPKIQQKAESLIQTINKQTDLSGTGVRKLMDTVDNAKFKTTGTDAERQSFNIFVNDLKNGLKDGINTSTDKLSEINAKYSADMQLSEAAQDIFGGVDFKNLSEVAKAANKLEGLFNEKGIDPKIIDDYLTRIGVDSVEFRTGEAVRQISNKETGTNTKGLSVGEMVQQTTSAVVTPKMVRDIAIKVGISEKKLIPFLRAMKPAARNILINALLQPEQ